jgi:hypothetical protein
MQISKTILIGTFVVCAAIIMILEYTFADSGSILYSMLFFVGLAQGPLAIVAAADIVKSKWVDPYRRELLSVRHMMLFIAVLFAIFALTGKIHLYDWSHHQNAWLNQQFFVIRNIVLLLLSWIVAGKFAKESLNDSPGKSTWGVFWVLMFVFNQTVVAFDWVMSLDYPWISTLFGAYFFVEAFYGGFLRQPGAGRRFHLFQLPQLHRKFFRGDFPKIPDGYDDPAVRFQHFLGISILLTIYRDLVRQYPGRSRLY